MFANICVFPDNGQCASYMHACMFVNELSKVRMFYVPFQW